MRDPSQHDDSAGETRRPPDEFTERLLARGGNVGVINVRQPQRQYARMADWVAERFAVLGALNARYATSDSRSAGVGAPLPIVSGRLLRRGFGAPNAEESSGATVEKSPDATDERSTPSSGETRAAEISAPSANAGSTQGASVVRRKAAPTAKRVGVPARTESQRGAPQGTPSHPAEERSAPLESASRVAKEYHSSEAPPTPATAMTLLRKTSEPSKIVEQEETDAVQHVASSDAKHLSASSDAKHLSASSGGQQPSVSVGVTRVQEGGPVVQTKSDVGVSATHILGRRRSAQPESAEAKRSVESREEMKLPSTLEQTHRVVAESDLREAREASDPLTIRREAVESNNLAAERRRDVAGDARSAQSPTPSALPLAAEQTASGHLQRKILRHAAVGATPTSQKGVAPPSSQKGVAPPSSQTGEASRANASAVDSGAEVSEAAERKQSRASAPEILQSPLRLSAARMVWRKRTGATPTNGADVGRLGHSDLDASPPTVLTRSSSQMLYRAGATALASRPSLPETGGEVETAAAPAQSNAGEVDLEQITEHVSRAILRRMAVERERRGIRRWL